MMQIKSFFEYFITIPASGGVVGLVHIINSNLSLKWYVIIFFLSLIILIVGQFLMTRDQKFANKMMQVLLESEIYCRLFQLKRSNSRSFYIVYGHKDDGHNHIVGHDEKYRIAGYPYDEAEMIIRLWSSIANSYKLNWSEVKTICSCNYGQNHEFTSGLNKSSISLIGSSKVNKLTKLVMEKIIKLEKLKPEKHLQRKHRYTIKIDEDEICYFNCLNKGEGDDLHPSKFDNNKKNEILTDYAMIMKLPNILGEKINRSQTIILIASCRVGGQFALTEWLSKTENIVYLVDTYKSNYFYVIFEIKYKFRKPIPEVISIEPTEIEGIITINKTI